MLGVLALFVALLLGCAVSDPESKSLASFEKAQDKYGADISLPVSSSAINDYVTELSALRSRASGSAGKLIEAELYSAQSFLYLNKAIVASSSLDYSSVSCSAKSVRDIVSSLKLADSFQKKAVIALNSLSSSEKRQLRPNQTEEIASYGESILELTNFFDDKC